MIAHIDCNVFYISCERVFRPRLIGKPVVALSPNDHSVIALSSEAKALGIKRGDHIKAVQRTYGQYNIIEVSSNLTLYGDMSSRVMEVLVGFCPDIEIYSIDEAFLNLTAHKFVDLIDYMTEAKKRILQYTGIPVSIGLGSTKALAKSANKYAKKVKADTGIHFINNDAARIEVLKWLPVGDVWGIGGEHEKTLLQLGLKTAYDFSLMQPEKVKELMTIVGYRLWCELNGRSKIDFEYLAPDKKGIGSAKSFGRNVTEFSDLREAMEVYLTRCYNKLRAQNSACKHLYLFLHTNPHALNEPQYFKGMEVELTVATCHLSVIKEEANKLLKNIYREGYNYKKVGVFLSKIIPIGSIQTNLFDNPNTEKNAAITEVFDKLNNLYGRDKIRFASTGYNHSWKARKEKVSLHYTTDKDDIIEIR